MVALPLGIGGVAGSFPGLAIRVTLRIIVRKEHRWWCIHLVFKTHEQSQPKSNIGSTSVSTKWWFVITKNTNNMNGNEQLYFNVVLRRNAWTSLFYTMTKRSLTSVCGYWPPIIPVTFLTNDLALTSHKSHNASLWAYVSIQCMYLCKYNLQVPRFGDFPLFHSLWWTYGIFPSFIQWKNGFFHKRDI